MTTQIDYYVSLNSPWAYMGGAQLAEIAAKAGAPVRVLPIQLPLLFEKAGGVPLPKRAPARQAYRLAELARWRDHLGIPITLQPKHFPSDETRAALSVIAAGNQGGDALALAIRLGKALWEDEQNLADEAVIAAAAADVGLDGAALLAACNDPAIASQWTANTEQALAAGVFGVPSYVVGEDVFWGQDRLDFVARAL